MSAQNDEQQQPGIEPTRTAIGLALEKSDKPQAQQAQEGTRGKLKHESKKYPRAESALWHKPRKFLIF